MSTTTLRGLFAMATLAAVGLSQLPKPVDGPPWWGVSDNDTVSIYWGFDIQATPYLHHANSVVPPWYIYPSPPNDGFTHPAPITWLPTVTSHTGCIGFTGNGTPLSAVLSLVVDNDPRVDWIKVFFVQVDVTDTATETVVSAIREVLGQYKRVSMSEEKVSLGSGWSRVTINAELLPQPDWEAVDFTLTETALGTVAIDNLFVSSKCIKPPPDQGGDALSDVDANQPAIPLAPVNVRCQAVAVTEDAAGVRSYWVSAAAQPSPGSTHQLLRLDPAGNPLGPATSVGAFSAASPLGLTGLTVERVAGPTLQNLVYGVRDNRILNGQIEILKIDASVPTPVILATVPLQLTGLALPPAPNRFGLTFFPPGNTGAGSFWLIDNQAQPGPGSAYEFARNGALLRPSAATASNLFNRLPPQVVGSGYDELTGMLYFMSSAPRQTPAGVTRTNGLEYSAYDYQPTGVQFFGDLTIPDPLPGSGSPGGVASAMHVYRRHHPTNPALNGLWRAAVIVLTGPAGSQTPTLYELKGPYRFGWNLLGHCGMAGDPPMRGATNFQVTLTGVPHANFAVLYAGFSNTTYGTFSLPLNLGPGPGNVGIAGLEESNISVSLDLSSVLLPVTNGSVAYRVPLLPAGVGPANVPLFFQWVVFDPSTPFGLATSQCGKTLIF
jgi:hypothetical protein